jgi:hypothetical protein
LLREQPRPYDPGLPRSFLCSHWGCPHAFTSLEDLLAHEAGTYQPPKPSAGADAAQQQQHEQQQQQQQQDDAEEERDDDGASAVPGVARPRRQAAESAAVLRQWLLRQQQSKRAQVANKIEPNDDDHKYVVHEPLSARSVERCATLGVDTIRLSDVNYETFYHRYLAGRNPVVLNGFDDAWVGLGEWTRDKLLELIPNHDVTVCSMCDGETGVMHDTDYSTFHRYAAQLPELYCKCVFQWPPEWPPLPQFERNYLHAVFPDGNYCRIYIGNRQSMTAYHRDTCDTSIVMVSGVKRVVLIPPGNQARIEEILGLKKNQLTNNSDFAYHGAELTAADHHRLALCGARIVHLVRGQTLFIPGGWWHTVTNLTDDTISISDGGVYMHNVHYFVSSEMPEQIDVRPLVYNAVEALHERLRVLIACETDSGGGGDDGETSERLATLTATLMAELSALATCTAVHMYTGLQKQRTPLIPPPLAEQNDLAESDRLRRSSEQETTMERVDQCYAWLAELTLRARVRPSLHKTYAVTSEKQRLSHH